MTFQLDCKTHDGVTYLDTPGLADVKLRQEAARAITTALRKSGTYQIFFVITLQAGRIRPEDMATIKLVLESCSDIKCYSIIINKLSKGAYDCLIKDNGEKLKILGLQINEQIRRVDYPPTVLLLKNREELNDTDDVLVKWDDLEKFARQAPCTIVNSNSVQEILPDSALFDKVIAMMTKQMEDLRLDKERVFQLKKHMEDRYFDLMEKRRPKAGVISSLNLRISLFKKMFNH